MRPAAIVAAVAITWATIAAVQVTADSTYLGCFRDKAIPAERDLGLMVAIEETRNTPGLCESICGARHGARYFGLQYGMECWCGDSYGKHGKLETEGDTPSTGCRSPCSGDKSQMCGGENLNSVYEITTRYPTPAAHPDGRPLLALVMIVKDEAHTLPATLLAIKPWIDVYYILDTGSTDGTQDAIRRALGPNGEVWEEPFIDYGRSRNRALEIAQTTKRLGGPPVFSLMLSADETVHNGLGLRTFCEEHRDMSGPQEEAYYIQMDVGWRFDSARLSRTDKGWRYVGRVHEYLASPTGRGSPKHRVPESYIKFKVTDEERRSNREWTILSILQQETREKPHDTRSSFYLARTYNVVKNHTAALAEFRRRVSLGGWREEVYESLYAIGWQLDSLKAPWPEIQQAFLDAHAHSPERAEPLYVVANHWYRQKNYALAYLFAAHAASLPYPKQAVLWVQADVYAWQCLMLVGMSGIEVHHEQEGVRALLRALEKRPNDAPMRQTLARYRSALGEEQFQSAECDVDHSKCRPGQQPSPPSEKVFALPATQQHDRIEPAAVPAPWTDRVHAPVAHQVPTGANVPLLYAVIAFLVVTNVVAFVRRTRAGPAACMPQLALGGGGGADKQV